MNCAKCHHPRDQHGGTSCSGRVRIGTDKPSVCTCQGYVLSKENQTLLDAENARTARELPVTKLKFHV